MPTRARLASTQRNLRDAVIHAPIAGIVSDRAVNTGDVVSPGTALFTIIDPSSMRLEASVSSDDLRMLRVGTTVLFEVRGYDRPFEGTIERIAPSADPATPRSRSTSRFPTSEDACSLVCSPKGGW